HAALPILLTLTEATNQSIQISGATTQEAAAGVIQFAQALASGELRGDELRSVLENMPRLAQAIADGLKTDIGGLRDLAEQGELTAERVTQALLGQAGVIESEFGHLDRTVGQAMTQLANETARAFSGTDVQPLIDSIDEFRELVSDPQMVESLTMLASALVKTFTVATKAIAGTVSAVQDLAEGAAAALHGPAMDDAVRIQERINELEARRAEMLERIGNRDIGRFRKNLEFYDQEIEKLQSMLDLHA